MRCRKTWHLRGLTAAVAFLPVCLAGCSPTPDDGDPLSRTEPLGGTSLPSQESHQSEALIAALARGEIDHDTYLAGYRRFSDCMRTAGFPLISESENNLVMTYSTVVGPAETECYSSEFEPLDVAWQIHQEDASDTAEIMRLCLTNRGIAPEPTLAAMNQQLIDEEIPFEDCLEPRG